VVRGNLLNLTKENTNNSAIKKFLELNIGKRVSKELGYFNVMSNVITEIGLGNGKNTWNFDVFRLGNSSFSNENTQYTFDLSEKQKENMKKVTSFGKGSNPYSS
jgi:hypothetical protein